MNLPPIALSANLNNEDDEGLNWSLLRNAADPSVIVEGAVLRAGTERFWSWVRISRIDEDGQVHFEQTSADEAPRRVPSSKLKPCLKYATSGRPTMNPASIPWRSAHRPEYIGGIFEPREVYSAGRPPYVVAPNSTARLIGGQHDAFAWGSSAEHQALAVAVQQSQILQGGGHLGGEKNLVIGFGGRVGSGLSEVAG